MGWFTPYKRKANEFKYTPRYFDPEKERREQRRRELCGESTADANKEYEVGQYIRTQRAARAEARATRQDRHGKGSTFVLFAGAALILVLVYMLYPRIVSAFATAQSNTESKQTEATEEFNPYAPITVVPNDYKEE